MVMSSAHVVPVCKLKMIKAEYRYIAPDDGPRFYGYQIDMNRNVEVNAEFDVPQEMADEFASELNALAALIRAHTRHREADPIVAT